MRPQKCEQRKYTKNEVDHEEPTVTNYPVVKEPSYFNIFEYGKNILNKFDATCKRAYITTPRDKYYMYFS